MTNLCLLLWRPSLPLYTPCPLHPSNLSFLPVLCTALLWQSPGGGGPPTPVFLPGESPWTEEPGGLQSPWGCKEPDTTEQLSTTHSCPWNILRKIVIWLAPSHLPNLTQQSLLQSLSHLVKPTCPLHHCLKWLIIYSTHSLGEGNGNPLQYSCLENPVEEEPGGLPSMGSHRDTTEATQQQQQQHIHWAPSGGAILCMWATSG